MAKFYMSTPLSKGLGEYIYIYIHMNGLGLLCTNKFISSAELPDNMVSVLSQDETIENVEQDTEVRIN